MKLQEHIEAIRAEIRKRFFAGEFIFIQCNEHVAEIEIAGIEFSIWVGNDHSENCEFWSGRGCFALAPEFKDSDERLACWKQIEPAVKEYMGKKLLESKKAKLEKLKKQIEDIEALEW